MSHVQHHILICVEEEVFVQFILRPEDWLALSTCLVFCRAHCSNSDLKSQAGTRQHWPPHVKWESKLRSCSFITLEFSFKFFSRLRKGVTPSFFKGQQAAFDGKMCTFQQPFFYFDNLSDMYSKLFMTNLQLWMGFGLVGHTTDWALYTLKQNTSFYQMKIINTFIYTKYAASL